MLIRKPLWLMSTEGGAAGAGEGGTGDSGSAGGSAGAGGESKPEGGKAGEEGKTFTQADVDRIIAGRLSKFADYDEIKAKLAEVEQANQTESEKAINAAKDEGRREARMEAAQEVALEAFNSAAGRRNPEYDTAPALELLSLSKFVKDDGSVDREAIKTAVERLVPEKEERKAAPTFGGGARKGNDSPEPPPGVGRLAAAYAERSRK